MTIYAHTFDTPVVDTADDRWARVRARVVGVGPATVTVASGVALTVAAFLPWFHSSLRNLGTRSINGFGSNGSSSWFGHVAVGWPLLLVGAALVACGGLALLHNERVPRPTVAVIGVIAFVAVLVERAHAHDQARANLQGMLASALKARPDQAAGLRDLAATARFTDAYGLWFALGVTVLAAGAGVALVRQGRQTTDR